MEADTFSNAGVVEFSNKNLVNLGLHTERNKELAEKYNVGPIPVTFFLSPDGERLATWVGYLTPDEYRKGIDRTLGTHKKLLDLAPRLKASPDDVGLLKESAGLYADLGDGRRAAEAYLKAAAKAPDAKAQGGFLIQAFKHLNESEGDDVINKAMADIATRLDGLDGEGKLGFRDDAAFARAMVDFNKQDWDPAIAKLEEVAAKWPDGDRAPEALVTLGDLYHHIKKDNKKAEKILKSVIEKYPKTPMAERAKDFLEHMKEHADK